MEKTLPFSSDTLEEIAEKYGTPIYVYNEQGIRDNAREVNEAFSWNPDYVNFFAVKAAPTPGILRVVHDEGMGFDCSSYPELRMVKNNDLLENGVFYTSNNTSDHDYRFADGMHAIINVDKYAYVDQVYRSLGHLPTRMAIRYNPGPLKKGNGIIGDPEKQKFGDTEEHILTALQSMKTKGVEEVGLHTMVVSNVREVESFRETARLLRELTERVVERSGIQVSFINIGGGIGVNYRPDEIAVDVAAIGEAVRSELDGLNIPVYSENGRYIAGPHGYLLTRVTHGIQESYESFVQVDTSINNIARLATVTKAYHQVDILGRENDPKRPMNVTGSMCANTDVFFRDHPLPTTIEPGDLMVIHDAGAHCRANSHNYNSKLRAGEVMVHPGGTHSLIRRHETVEDLERTVDGL